ncbi:hypothetical protein CSV80_05855 [Sporosarcina sp. P12(2017)]|uniref:hypothetical protein n=1 Tax=unclassified Sporosarcina TaxID=2647733 RepID=UPI000C16EDCC|nr:MULTISPECIES: hypothetical protein [unclassified Sporosarcina]PIC58291.1 hypothetical protein CSV81_03875 [Sporosarcina sp. P10]PIC61544.1 hypothetical protein CSV80_05855 [Sporosarcina sp. P12(2017)]
MKKKSKTGKITILLSMLCLVVLVSVGSVNAAISSTLSTEKKPYQYDFFSDASLKYNGFSGAKKLAITFDKSIKTASGAFDGKVAVYQKQGNAWVALPLVESITPSNKNFMVTFKNLEFIDASKGLDLELRVEKETFYFDQTSEYVFPFKVYDVLPSFHSVFATTSNMKLINENIFKTNAPRDVKLYLPKLYVNKIETIHRADGMVQDLKSSHLTNIDILTDEEATRLKVDFNGDAQHHRDLDRRTDLKGFSMGQAGIDATVCDKQTGAGGQVADDCDRVVDDFTLTAFDLHGRRLAERTFKVKVNPSKSDTPSKNDILKNDYIKAPDKAFGQVKSLYDLTADPKLSKTVFEQLPVREYDRIGVMYSLGRSIKVKNEEQLRMAIAHSDFTSITLGDHPIVLSSPLRIEKNMSLFNGKIKGDIILGDGSRNNMFRLKNVDIEGELEIHAGVEGTVILDSSSAQSTVIRSGGIHSIHMNDYSSVQGITMRNTSPVRLVTTYTDRNNYGTLIEMTIDSEQEIVLEGSLEELKLNVTEGLNRKIIVKDGIDQVTRHADSSGHLMVTRGTRVSLPNPLPLEWTTSDLSSEDSGYTEVVRNAGLMENTMTVWNNGQALDIKKFGFPEGLRFDIESEDESIFGGSTKIQFEDEKLRIIGETLSEEDVITHEVRLSAIQGSSKYMIKIQVTILQN